MPNTQNTDHNEHAAVLAQARAEARKAAAEILLVRYTDSESGEPVYGYAPAAASHLFRGLFGPDVTTVARIDSHGEIIQGA